MTSFAQSILLFVVMLGLSVFCSITLVRALRRQNKTTPDPRRVLLPYLGLCAVMDLILAPYLPHLSHGGASSLLLPLCVLGLPAIQHSVLLTTAVPTKVR